jgi:ankyrin repeat protein
MDIVKKKIKSALETQNYRIYCEIFEELSEEEISRLARLYKVDPDSPRRVICDKLVEVLKTKFVSLPNEIIDKIMMESSPTDIKRWKDFERMNKRTYLKKKNSTLTEAASEGNLLGVEYLLQNGADLEREGYIALFQAAANNHLNVVRYLMIKGVDISGINGYYMLSAVISNGHIDVLKYLLENDVEYLTAENMVADAFEHMDIVNYLLEKYKNIDYDVVYFISSGRDVSKEFLDALLSRGANTMADFGNHMSYAIHAKNQEVLDFLLEKGASVNAAFESASLSGYLDSVKFLLKTGLIDQTRINDAYLHAASRAHKDIMNFLKDKVDKETRDRALVNPVDLAFTFTW